MNMSMSILPGGPIASYLRDAELTLEQFRAKLRAGEVAVTSVYASEQLFASIEELRHSLEEQRDSESDGR
jgi:hypothetical protein